ncbi:MAG TPA: preprotein translocase subunit YajC [Rickettsiales bacterium]|nr:preprotein translocase subunit YajC [Rickettsiales bacterium]
MFFISQAFAETMPQTPNFQNFIGSLVPLLIFVAIFYFLLIRPQQKKQQQHEKEIAALKPNDKVITAGGIFAKVLKVKEKSLVLEISKDVEIEVVPSTVSPIIEETTETKKEDKKITTKKKK